MTKVEEVKSWCLALGINTVKLLDGAKYCEECTMPFYPRITFQKYCSCVCKQQVTYRNEKIKRVARKKKDLELKAKFENYRKDK